MNAINFLMLRIFRRICFSRVAMIKRWICVTHRRLHLPNLFIYPDCILYWNLCFVIFRKSHRDFLGLRQTIVKREVTTRKRIKLKNWIQSWSLRLLTSIKTAISHCHRSVHQTWIQCLSEVACKVKIQLKVRFISIVWKLAQTLKIYRTRSLDERSHGRAHADKHPPWSWNSLYELERVRWCE